MSGWRNKIFRTVALLFLALLTISGCTKQESSKNAVAPGPRIVRLSQINEPADLDPAKAALPDEFFIIRALSEGLITSAPDGTPRAAAAERWEVSADGLVYTFHLRTDRSWSNGEPVAAADFVASYQRLLTPATAAPKASLFYAVKKARAFVSGTETDFSAVGFRAVDSHTLVVTLERPTPSFLAYVASGPWIPTNPRVVARHGIKWTRPENFVGNGPFTLVEWRPNQRIVVRRNPRYPSAAHVHLDEIHFLAFDNRDTEERAYRAGQVDVTMAVAINRLEAYARERPAELHSAPLAETRYLTFNTQHPPLNDVRVRRALALAIDREKIVTKVLQGGQEAAFRFVPRTLRGNEKPGAPTAWTLKYDADEARRLLAAAGFPEGRGFPHLELVGWANTPVLEAVQAMWKKELGIVVTLAKREAKVHIAALRAGQYEIAFVTEIPDVADALQVLAEFVTGASGNHPHWSDAAYDALIARAVAADDLNQQTALLVQAEQRFIDAAPVAPLYFNAKNWLMRTSVRGWQEDELWSRHYQDLYLDEK